MFAQRIAKLAAVAVTGATLGVTALVTAGTAGAISADDSFLSDLEAAGITYDDANAVVRSAHAICDALDDGYEPKEIAEEILSVNDLSVEQVATIVVSSVLNYCPENEVMFT